MVLFILWLLVSSVYIRAIYEALDGMGFEKGNILEPSMGVGNFFGMLPDSMLGSRLYGEMCIRDSSGDAGAGTRRQKGSLADEKG